MPHSRCVREQRIKRVLRGRLRGLVVPVALKEVVSKVRGCDSELVESTWCHTLLLLPREQVQGGLL